MRIGLPFKHRSRTMATASAYESWSKDQLITRLIQLESSTEPTKQTQVAPRKAFQFNSYIRRKIALKFCYSGWEYNGLAFQIGPTPLPTVEGVIFDALAKARLIDPEAGFEGCDWEKCGRTDRGVSAAGQVISLWVRSTAEKANNDYAKPAKSVSDIVVDSADDGFGPLNLDDGEVVPPQPVKPTEKAEHNYITLLNRLLPPTIRMLAWSPVSEKFSARFSCKYRHYKYFFSSEGLDISLMQDAASRFVGAHDFRNLCKLDPGKQITVFKRIILKAQVDPVDNAGTPCGSDENGSRIYVLNLVGSAFLYHQVRHIMAILLMIGRGLEHPSVVTSLMNVEEGMEQGKEGEDIEVVRSKPEYQMADALPLMLWDCAYSPDDVNWRTHGKDPDMAIRTEDDEDYASGFGLYRHLSSIHERSLIHTALNDHFLQAASVFHRLPRTSMIEVPLGGGTLKRTSQYTPLLRRNRLDTVEVMNERWRVGKGSRREQKKHAECVESEILYDEGDE